MSKFFQKMQKDIILNFDHIVLEAVNKLFAAHLALQMKDEFA